MNCKTRRCISHSRVLRGLAVALVMIAALSSLTGGVPEAKPLPKPPPVTAGDIAKLVVQLGDESYPVREQATTNLWKLADKALPALRKASEGKDPEISDRADELILYISIGLLLDSPEEVKKLVVQFSRSSANEKLTILRKLLGMGHWKQVLHLAKLEKNPAARKKMASIVKETAARAAREAIVKGDLDLAGEILSVSADDAPSMLMLAWYYDRRGQLKEQLEKAAESPGKRGALWRMSLHRAGGNLTSAITEADKAGRDDLADAMRVIKGNALPWLRRSSSQPNLDAIYNMGCQIQIARMEGKEKRAAQLARELSRLAGNNDTTVRAANALAANGFRKKALDLIVKQDVLKAFDYYESTEYPQLSLEIMGIPRDAKPPYTAWVKKFTAHAIDEEDDALYKQLLTLARFLVNHGQGEHASAVLTPMMVALEADGSDDWFNLLPEMARYGLGAEAVQFIKKRGNEDGDTDLAVKKLFNRLPKKSLSNIWQALKKRNEKDLPKALHEIALLAGLIADPMDEVNPLHKALLDDVAAADAPNKDTREAALFSFLIKRNDLAVASRMADQLAAGNDRWAASKIYLDAALLRWAKIEPIYAAKAKKSPGDFVNLTHLYIASRKLGRAQKADELYERILMLSMGDAQILIKAGEQLHEAGYGGDAVELWLRAAVLADGGSTGFDSAIAHLASYGQPLYQKKAWRESSAIAEVYMQLAMRGRGGALLGVLRARFRAEFCQGMLLLKNGNKASALKKLNGARKLIPGDGMLADDFFPTLRRVGIGKAYDQWFEDSYSHIAAACKLYPGSHNSQNTAAWLASRAVRKLDAAHAHSEAALKSRPYQGAYLDTMAEVWFARGNRAKAVKWSEKAVAGSIDNAQGYPRREQQVIANFQELSKQLERFKNAPLPNR